MPIPTGRHNYNIEILVNYKAMFRINTKESLLNCGHLGRN